MSKSSISSALPSIGNETPTFRKEILPNPAGQRKSNKGGGAGLGPLWGWLVYLSLCLCFLLQRYRRPSSNSRSGAVKLFLSESMLHMITQPHDSCQKCRVDKDHCRGWVEARQIDLGAEVENQISRGVFGVGNTAGEWCIISTLEITFWIY